MQHWLYAALQVDGPTVSDRLPFLDVSSLNSAAPRGAALFLPTPGGRVARPFFTVCRTGSTVRTPSYGMLAGILTVRQGVVSARLASRTTTWAPARSACV